MKDRILWILGELVEGRHQAFTAACVPDVRWWLPTNPDWLTGREAVCRALRPVLLGADLVRPDTVITADDDSLMIIELTVRSPARGRTPVTSVLRLADEHIMSGMTYLDVAAVDRPEVEDR